MTQQSGTQQSGTQQSGTQQSGFRRGAAVAAVPLAALLAAGGARAQTAPNPIKIGIFMSLSGGSAASSASNRFGAELAIQEINAAGGIAHRPVVAVYGDDQADPTTGVSEMKRLVFQEKVDVVVGPNISQVNLAALPVLNEGKIASISDTGSPALTPEAGPYHFTVEPSVTNSGKQMADYAVQTLHAKKPALLNDDGAAAQGASASIKATLESLGTKLAGQQQFKFHPGDVTPQLLSLRRANPDVMFVEVASPDDAGVIQKNLQEVGWPVREIGSLAFGASGPYAVKVAGPDAFKYSIAQTFKRFTYCASTGHGDPVINDFIKRVTAAAKAKGLSETDFFNIASEYDGVYVLKAAIEGSGSTQGPAIAAWIETHVGEVPAVSAEHLVASKTNHFMIGDDALTMAKQPDRRNEDGLMERADKC